ncbi:MAG: TIGR03067 domain-containing protein [Planctomycetota bacterium]
MRILNLYSVWTNVKIQSLLVVAGLLTLAGCSSETKAPQEQTETSASEEQTDSVEPEAQQAEAPSPLGKWKAVAGIMGGSPLPDEFVASTSLELKESEYFVVAANQPDNGTCEIDTTSSPGKMTLTGVEGPNAGKTMLAIFDFTDEGQMRIAYDLTGESHPENFESTADNGHYLATYERVE